MTLELLLYELKEKWVLFYDVN